MYARVTSRGLGDMAAITSPAQLADSNGNVLAYDQGLQRFRMVPASQAMLAGCTSQGTNMGLWSVNPACGCVGQTFLTTNPASVPSNVDPRFAPCNFTPVVAAPSGAYLPITGPVLPAGALPPIVSGPVSVLPPTAPSVYQSIPGAGSPPVGSVASTAAASAGGVQSSGSSSFFDSAMAWVQENPLLAAGAAAAVLFFVVKR